jgi:hypothetical protein
MQGYIQVNPRGTPVASLQRPNPETVEEIAALLRH